MSESEPSRGLAAAFALAAAAALVPLWSVEYPPMVDLPQHAAQITLWRDYADPLFPYREIFELHPFSPYLIGHSLVRFFDLLLPITVAVRVMVSLAVLALPAAMLYLFRRLGADRWPALLGFPLAYGFGFQWGFTNFMIAAAVTLVFVAAGIDYARHGGRSSGVLLALFAFALYLCHALALGLAVLIIALAVLVESGGRPRSLLRLLPLVPALVVVGLWFGWVWVSDPNTAQPPLWVESPGARLVDLPALWVGAGREAGPWLVGGLLVLALPLVGGRIAARPAVRWLPLAAALGFYFALPNRAFSAWMFSTRFSVFVAIFALLLVVPAASAGRRRLGRSLMLAFALSWMGFITVEFRAFDAEARHFDALLERMAPGRRVLGLNFDPGYDHVGGLPVFGHFHMWYQAKKGGLAEPAFAIGYPNLVVYRHGPFSHPELSLHPERFDFARDGRFFDYFLVRSEVDVGARLFAGAPVVFAARSGRWWLYRRLEFPSLIEENS